MIADETALTKPLRYANEYDLFDSKKESAIKHRQVIRSGGIPGQKDSNQTLYEIDQDKKRKH